MKFNTKTMLIVAAALVVVIGAMVMLRDGNGAAEDSGRGTTTAQFAPDLNSLSGTVISISPTARKLELRGDGGNVPVAFGTSTTFTDAAGAATTFAAIRAGSSISITGTWGQTDFMATAIRITE